MANAFAGGGGHFVAVQEPLVRRDAERAATIAAVAASAPPEVGVFVCVCV